MITDIYKVPDDQDKSRHTNTAVEVIFEALRIGRGAIPSSWVGRYAFTKGHHGELLTMVMGTYPARLVVDLLAQHKEMLGERSVESISVWTTSPADSQGGFHVDNVKLNLVFKVGDGGRGV